MYNHRTIYSRKFRTRALKNRQNYAVKLVAILYNYLYLLRQNQTHHDFQIEVNRVGHAKS